MSNLSRWLTVSKEDADEAFDEGTDVAVDSDEIEQEIDSVGEELGDTSVEMEDAVEAHEALEAYADLVRNAKARREDISPLTARAIYIGLEGFGVKTAILPSVESFGNLSVSVELLDKLKDGAKYVKEKIIELYKKIKELIQRLIDWFKKDKEADKEKVKKLEEAAEEMVEAKNATESPKVLTESEVKRIEQAPKKEEDTSSKPKGSGKELVVAGNRDSFVYIDDASLLYRDGDPVIFDAEVLLKSVKESDEIITKLLDMLNNDVDVLFSKTVNSGEEAHDVIFELLKKYGIAPGGIAEGTDSDSNRLRNTKRFGLGSFCVLWDIDFSRKVTAPAGTYLKMGFDTIALKSISKKYYTPPTRGRVDSLMGVFSELSSEIPMGITEGPSIIEDLKGATDENAIAKMNFINRNYVTLQAQYLRYRRKVINQIYNATYKAINSR